MGTTNEELMAQAGSRVEKAIIATDALASAGKLNPQQADKFIDYVIDQSMLKNNARIVRFNPEQMEINKIGIGRRVAMPAAEAQDPRKRRGISTSKIVLQPREVIVPWEVTDSAAEVNLEGAALLDHIVQMMAKQCSNDLEELYINADTLGPAILESDYVDGGDPARYVRDDYLAMFNGWLRLADTGSHLYDAAGANVGATIFSRMLNSLPTKWRRDRASLRFYIAPDLEQLYREKTSTRATGVGDAAYQSNVTLTPFGVPLIAAPLFPMYPKVVEHLALPAFGAGSVFLRYKPIVTNSDVVTLQTLAATPVTPYVRGAGNDYSINPATGEIAALAGGALAAGANIKVTYLAKPQVLLTHQANYIVGIGRDVRIEKDRDIFKRVNQYVITLKVAVQFEETDAVVKGVNVNDSV